MERYICIHGHFYQPPRENPWLEAIELQDSAHPFHDWNERITAECYAPNAVSRILNERGRIAGIVNNYARMSFNFGPTLLAWLEQEHPDLHAAVVEADRESRARCGGHGNAMAQAYSHMILPLADDRDRRTQVLWGIRDFERRFGRKPEGMWLPETAVDTPSLEAMAEAGIRFTVLAPAQAKDVRRLDEGEWIDVEGEHVDPRMAYLVRLPSRREIAVFFYDGPTSRAIAFERLLESGEAFAGRIQSLFRDSAPWPQLVHVATDGETYGHHHRFGDMALARALQIFEQDDRVMLTNYAQFLEKHPPRYEARIRENTSWSCVHGVERWRSDCGCRTGGEESWTQAWRGPLRDALDYLRDAAAPLFERAAGEIFRDPWAARDAYIDVVLDRSPESADRFLAAEARRSLTPEDEVRGLKLMELQRQAMLMYTSCGWFFNELSGIETVQILRYAGRVAQLARELFQEDLETEFLERLGAARSNLPQFGDGRGVYERLVRPARVDLARVAAHYAVSLPFENYESRTRLFGFTVEQEDVRREEAGNAMLAVGRVRVTAEATRERESLCFAVLHLGDHNVTAGVHACRSVERHAAMVGDVREGFARADLAYVLRRLDHYFQGTIYSLESLFLDEQRKVLEGILERSLTDAEAAYGQLYRAHAPLMRYLNELHIPLPEAFQFASRFVLGRKLLGLLQNDDLPAEHVVTVLNDARKAQAGLDGAVLGYEYRQTLERALTRAERDPDDAEFLRRIDRALSVVPHLPFEVDLWQVQNLYHRIARRELPVRRDRAARGDAAARAWLEAFTGVGERLAFHLG